MRLILPRYAYLPTCTLGRLYAGDHALATIERPWIPNPGHPGGTLSVSCVPDGTYRLVPHSSAKFPNCWALVNEALGVYYQHRPAGQAWGRTAILIHVGNTVTDVIGCIAVGMRAVTTAGQHGVANSREAMAALLATLGRTEHELVIRPAGTVERPVVG